MKSLKHNLKNLKWLKKSFRSIFTFTILLVIIFNIISPTYAVEYGNVNSGSIISWASFIGFNWLPNFEFNLVTIENPFKESEEVKKISGILEEGSKFQYVKGVNSSASRLPNESGDCWAMSDWLYKNIKKTDVECRIIQYETSLSAQHRSVQIKSEGEWVDLPYMRYGFDSRFAAASSKPGMFVYKGG